MFDSPELLVLLCLSALAAGVVNSLAGGGTLLTFSALQFALAALGSAEAAVLANGTSTVALMPGSVAGAWGYRRQMAQARRWFVLLVGPSLVGGGVGTLLVTRLPAEYFADLVPWLLLVAALLFTAQSMARKNQDIDLPPADPSSKSIVLLALFQFGVAVYGGYFGAGIGILMLGSLGLMGVGNVHQMNALKTVLASCINGVSVAVFVYDGMVVWKYALPMAAAAIVGGYLGAHGAQRVKPRVVRWIIVSIAFGLAIYYFVRQASGAT
jgi:uncharacterized membrane protein YfcA